jgi:hypothetical protein
MSETLLVKSVKARPFAAIQTSVIFHSYIPIIEERRRCSGTIGGCDAIATLATTLCA